MEQFHYEKVVRRRVKLLNPQPPVKQTLDVVGLRQYLDVYTGFEIAPQSFEA